MSRRRARIDARLERRRIEDGALLDAALAPYEHALSSVVLDLRTPSSLLADDVPASATPTAAAAADQDELLTITLGGSATIDIRRSQGRVSVIRTQPRQTVTAAL